MTSGANKSLVWLKSAGGHQNRDVSPSRNSQHQGISEGQQRFAICPGFAGPGRALAHKPPAPHTQVLLAKYREEINTKSRWLRRLEARIFLVSKSNHTCDSE